jgi:hypothetical protein
MSAEQVSEFVRITKGTRADAMIWLAKYDNDVGKASLAFMGQGPRGNEYYAGGARSGIAVLAGPEDGTVPENQYVKPKAPQPFQFVGSGRKLGDGSSGPPPPQPAAPVRPAKTDYTTPGQPKTRVRFELPNAPPLMLWVNMSATVGDLKAYYAENYPQAAGHDLTLECVVPPKKLDDDSVSVEAAGLKMASLRCFW